MLVAQLLSASGGAGNGSEIRSKTRTASGNLQFDPNVICRLRSCIGLRLWSLQSPSRFHRVDHFRVKVRRSMGLCADCSSSGECGRKRKH